MVVIEDFAKDGTDTFAGDDLFDTEPGGEIAGIDQFHVDIAEIAVGENAEFPGFKLIAAEEHGYFIA